MMITSLRLLSLGWCFHILSRKPKISDIDLPTLIKHCTDAHCECSWKSKTAFLTVPFPLPLPPGSSPTSNMSRKPLPAWPFHWFQVHVTQGQKHPLLNWDGSSFFLSFIDQNPMCSKNLYLYCIEKYVMSSVSVSAKQLQMENVSHWQCNTAPKQQHDIVDNQSKLGA